MKLLSVNVSAIREVDDGDKRVRTGIFKAPVDGPVSLDKLNLAGDDQADRKSHGGEHKAVYAFGQQHLPHWQEALEREDIGPGFFGENLSVDLLDEATLRVGDRLSVGSCLLEITQPRVPCFKLGLRGGVRSLPRSFIRYGRTGAYLRVIEVGYLQTGDALALEQRGPDHHSLAELFATVYDLDGVGRRDVLEAALENPALSDEWRDVVTGKLQRLGAG